MKEILEGVVGVLARAGKMAAVIIVGDNGTIPLATQTAPAKVSMPPSSDLGEKFSVLEAAFTQEKREKQALIEELEQERLKKVGPADVSMLDENGRLKQEVERLKLSAQPSVSMQPWYETAVSNLGFEDKTLKLCHKSGWATAGHLMTAFTSGALEAKEITQKQWMEIVGKLMKLGATTQPLPSAASGSDPRELKRRPWEECIAKAREKEKLRYEFQNKLYQLETLLTQGQSVCQRENGEQVPIAREKEELARRQVSFHAQMATILWCLNLDPSVLTVDAALMPPQQQVPPAPVQQIQPQQLGA